MVLFLVKRRDGFVVRDGLTCRVDDYDVVGFRCFVCGRYGDRVGLKFLGSSLYICRFCDGLNDLGEEL